MIADFLVAASILSAAALFLYLARLAIECRARERAAALRAELAKLEGSK